MASSNSNVDRPVPRLPPWLGWWLSAGVMLALSWYMGNVQRDSLLTQLEVDGRQQLDLYVSHLAGQLDEHDFLPALLADDHRLRALLESPQDPGLQDQANRFLAHVNTTAGSLDVYLMDARGVTLAASNWQQALTFVGRNFGFRPYFIEAMQGRAGRYYALGTTSGRRGYYFSYPVGAGASPLGVVVVKIEIDTLENAWRSQDSELVVTDPDGVIFISTRPQWRYRALQPLRAEVIERIRASRRYPDAELTAVFGLREKALASGAQILEGVGPDHAGYISLATDMPQAGWRVQLLMSQKVVNPQVWQTRLFALSLLLLLSTAGWLFAHRNRRRRERELEKRQVMQEALDELEGRVSQRTLDLTEANRLLRQEIEQHQQTRDELIQAAKLAALGQMSAGINHELNQPLAAMRAYADNARAYLARENLEQAAWNLQQITELTGRMAQISGQLKVFSRKSSGQRIRVSLRACLEGALRILRSRIEQVDAELVTDLPPQDLFLSADMVQLEQVLVNLIGNACDVLVDQPRRRIEVGARARGPVVVLQVRDSGPGIPQQNLEKVFDPFFTTTENGLGLGLSISHTIAQRLGGSLTAGNATSGGAVFNLTLTAWPESAAAGE